MLNCTLRLSGRIASQHSNDSIRKSYFKHKTISNLSYQRGVNSANSLIVGINRQSVDSIDVYIDNNRFYSAWPSKNRNNNSNSNNTMSANVAATSNESRSEQSDRTYSSQSTTQPNRLISEKSPYLLQHAYNPVDWYPWCDEAIQKAKSENKLIFLSVGYATCHWCHVMEKESFENPDVAAVMNAHFINIKVDREERPDVDKTYMKFVLMLNDTGGWPMSVWLTPNLTPITAGTYFPPTDRWGVPSFTKILMKIADLWQNKPDDVLAGAQKVVDLMRQYPNESGSSASSTDNIDIDYRFNELATIYKQTFDDLWGGFGKQTKFPEASKINMGFHSYIHRPDAELAKLSLTTLRNMVNGGIRDHVFGGFCRYAVDRQWHIPHFEKMLYDQGQLLTAFTSAYKLTRDTVYLSVADQIYAYLVRDLRHPKGGFFCGEDADSHRQHNDDVKVEGAFYAWTYDEVQEIFLQNSDAFKAANSFEIYCHYYGINQDGNVAPTSDPHGHLLDRNILRVRTTVRDTAHKFGITSDDVSELLKVGNELLYNERCKRPRPQLDTKIVTAWNGLVLSGLSNLSTIHGSPRREEYLHTARELMKFLKTNTYNADEKKLMRACYGESVDSDKITFLQQPVDGFLDDYAFLIRGLIDYYVATLDIEALQWAKDLQDTQNSLFWDNDKGGYFYTEEMTPNSIIRMKEDHDGAEPCGNSVSAGNLLFISAYFQQRQYKEYATKLFDFFQTKPYFGYVLPGMFSAQLMRADSLTMMVVVGPQGEQVDRLFNIARGFYIPELILLHYDPNDSNQTITRESICDFKMVRNEPTVYLCHNRVCQLPIMSCDDLERCLKGKYLPLVLQP